MTFSDITLLIVEDDDDAREIVGLMIGREFPKITLYFAENGRKGVELFREHEANIVMTDFNMPVMDGSQMAHEISEIKSDTKFIVLSAYNEKKHLGKFNDINVSRYLQKPLEFILLFNAIHECIAEIRAKQN